MTPGLQIEKVPRDDPIPDIPINFDPLENLHLELLENKKKIKKGLPLIPKKPRKPPKPVTKKEPDDKIELEFDTSKIQKKKKKKKKERKVLEEEDIVKQLGEDSSSSSSEVEEEVSEAKTEDGDISEIVEEEEEEEEDPYAGMTPEEKEAYQKQEYIWRFRILKKQYRNAIIPEFNEFSDLTVMKRTYELKLKELTLEDSVDNYRTYLMGGFMILEMACTQWLGINMSGFTVQQSKMMHKYERLLVELGERSYSTFGRNLPVEARLIGTILFQAAIFYVGKLISDKIGNSFGNIFGAMTGQTPAPETENPPPKPEKKMRGPRIRAEDIRGKHEKEE